MGQAEVEESFEVDDRVSGGESDLVAGDAAVAALSVAVGDEPALAEGREQSYSPTLDEAIDEYDSRDACRVAGWNA